MKVLSVTSGRNTPSARYRIRQHLPELNKMEGLSVSDYCPRIEKNKSVPLLSTYSPKYYLPLYAIWQSMKVIDRLSLLPKSSSYDKLWLNRELITGYRTIEPFLKTEICLDVDDAIWMNPPYGDFASKKLAFQSTDIICGNEMIAEWFSQYNKNCHIVPTSVDTDYLRPKDILNKDKISIGWVGTHGNFKYVEKILTPILNILNKYDYVELLIVADKEPDFLCKHKRIKFIKWSAQLEVENFQSIDIGIMPLFNDEWARSKCAYKILQHMSCGTPVVASPVGMNKNVLNDSNSGLAAVHNSDWYDALNQLILNSTLRNNMGITGRQYILNNYSNRIVVDKIGQILRGRC